MAAAADRPLLLPDGVVFTCQQSGACCRSDWLIGVDDAAHARLRDVAWARHDPALGRRRRRSCRCRSRCRAASETVRAQAGRRLRVPHRGYALRDPPPPRRSRQAAGLPRVPLSLRGHARRRRGRRVVRVHRGARPSRRPLAAQRDEVHAVLAGSTRVERLPEPLTLYGSIELVVGRVPSDRGRAARRCWPRTGAAARRAAGRQRAAEPVHRPHADRGARPPRGPGAAHHAGRRPGRAAPSTAIASCSTSPPARAIRAGPRSRTWRRVYTWLEFSRRRDVARCARAEPLPELLPVSPGARAAARRHHRRRAVRARRRRWPCASTPARPAWTGSCASTGAT